MIAWVKRWWGWVAAGLLTLAVAIKAFAAGRAQAWSEARAERAKVRRARAVRYKEAREAAEAKADQDLERRLEIDKPTQADWEDLRRRNEDLDKEEDRR